jgi:hypothetical protein
MTITSHPLEASEATMTTAERLHEEGFKQGFKGAFQEGCQEGCEEAQRENLLLLLTKRFGQLPEPILARIRDADLVLLDRWFDRGITAASLDAVFTDEP